MQKTVLFIAAGAIAISAAAAVSVSLNRSTTSEELLFWENVEALTDSENDYGKAIWIKHNRKDGGFNCTRGGEETC